MKKVIFISSVFIVLFTCSCRKNKTDVIQSSNSQTEIKDTLSTKNDSVNNGTNGNEPQEAIDSSNVSKDGITAEMAYEGINNYCHGAYDWSIVEDDENQSENPSIMYLKMGEETQSEYQVIFRSYTGAFVYFYVDKKSGLTRMVESVPTLDVENEIGTINLFDYIGKKD